ncbi:MAG: DUF429 domain-containing protein [Verrucomicrobiales bacterium]|nr:DUF429 domain-containing protein [Verrucomicrobiales bacterium]
MEKPVSTTIIGIDLAWGERNPDGISVLEFPDGLEASSLSVRCGLAHGDEELLEQLLSTKSDQVFVAIDAPTLGTNETGSRPVDRECSRLFRKQEAGCHPVNRTLCTRPFRVAEKLLGAGFVLSADLRKGHRLAAEVYPHPAMVRLFGLEKTIKYKRSPVANRRTEFSRYQDCFRNFVAAHLPSLAGTGEFHQITSLPWNKNNEDKLDSLFCAAIGWWHLRFDGKRSQVLGDEESGQMLIPRSPKDFPVSHSVRA